MLEVLKQQRRILNGKRTAIIKIIHDDNDDKGFEMRPEGLKKRLRWVINGCRYEIPKKIKE